MSTLFTITYVLFASLMFLGAFGYIIDALLGRYDK